MAYRPKPTPTAFLPRKAISKWGLFSPLANVGGEPEQADADHKDRQHYQPARLDWKCGQATSIYTRKAPAKVNVVAQIREMMRLMDGPPSFLLWQRLQQKGRRPKPTPFARDDNLNPNC